MADTPAWRPGAGPDIAGIRAAMLARARQYFAAADVMEVETPALSAAAVSDPNIESLQVSTALDPKRPYYLHTSPEYCMKRLLCAGYPDIYQICRVFRDKEAGRLHQPEFTMIEWYRLGFRLRDMIDDTVRLIAAVAGRDNLTTPPDRISYSDAFRNFASCDPFEASVDELAGAANADESLRDSLGDDRNGWLDLILGDVVAKKFAPDRLTVLYHYPLAQGALARRCPSDQRVADRFEVFLGTAELANGYVELTDPAQQQRRFAADQAQRKAQGKPLRETDNAFLAALAQGLPPCAGVAVGFDRLVMLATGSDDIRQILSFAFTERFQT